jgi:hypothetical protein
MSTEAQTRANRRNAQKSTGPRSRQGKAAVSQNAVKHGLLTRQNVITSESQADFDLYRSCFVNAISWNFLKYFIICLSWFCMFSFHNNTIIRLYMCVK